MGPSKNMPRGAEVVRIITSLCGIGFVAYMAIWQRPILYTFLNYSFQTMPAHLRPSPFVIPGSSVSYFSIEVEKDKVREVTECKQRSRDTIDAVVEKYRKAGGVLNENRFFEEAVIYDLKSPNGMTKLAVVDSKEGCERMRTVLNLKPGDRVLLVGGVKGDK